MQDDDTMKVGIDPWFLARIPDLVEQGEYGSVDEFVNEAVLLRLDPDPVGVFFESPRGRRLLMELIREEMERPPATSTLPGPDPVDGDDYSSRPAGPRRDASCGGRGPNP